MKPLEPNSTLQNRYNITEMIGKGGMGEVYLAIDQRLGHSVALKRTTVGDDPLLAEAFEREARTLAQLRHGVLPKVSDHFLEDNEQYLVMEYISGEDLSERIKATGKAFPLEWIMFWADQLLDALTYLHTQNPPIIHRDIKPQNLKLTGDNNIVLLDFGLSKSTVEKTQVTTSGSVVGYTPHYASMEQIRGTGTNSKSDIFSLSATLYQLATNVIPPDALTRADAMLSGMVDPLRPPSQLNSEIPASISEAIIKGMEISQEKRFESAREMQKTMRRAFNNLQKSKSAETLAFNTKDVGINDSNADSMLEDQTAIMPNMAAEATEILEAERTNKAAVENKNQPEIADQIFATDTNAEDISTVKTEVIEADELNSVLGENDLAENVQQPKIAESHQSEGSEVRPTEQVQNTQVSVEEPIDTLETQEDFPAPIPTAPNIDMTENIDRDEQENTAQFNEPEAENQPSQSSIATPPVQPDQNTDSLSEVNAESSEPVNLDEQDVSVVSSAVTATNAAVTDGGGRAVATNAQSSKLPKQKSSTGKYVAILGGLGVVLFLLLGSALAVGLYYSDFDLGFGSDKDKTETEKPENIPTEEPNQQITETESPATTEPVDTEDPAESTVETENTDTANTNVDTKPEVTKKDKAVTTKPKTTTKPKVNPPKKQTARTTKPSGKTTKKPPAKTTTKPPQKKPKKDAGVL